MDYWAGLAPRSGRILYAMIPRWRPAPARPGRRWPAAIDGFVLVDNNRGVSV